jgi:hypothetical protein
MRFRSVTLVLLLLAGCGGDDPEPTASRPPATTSPATTSPTATAPAAAPTATPTPTPEGVDPLDGAGTDPVVAQPANTETALLTAVRAARHEGYDRVVFEFGNELPGYDVRYAAGPVTADGSGDQVDVDGAHAVVVRMEMALDADLSKEGAPLTYRGPTTIVPSTPTVAELARLGGFEGALTWVVGLRDRVDFRVTTLRSPPRLVIDYRNH